MNNHIKVDGVSFTQREFDVISCILNGRTSGKSISDFLSISVRTTETHKRNIMNKLSCHSWEGIREFCEKSQELFQINVHYQFLKNKLSIKDYLGEKGFCEISIEKIILVEDSQSPSNLSFFIKKFKEDLEDLSLDVRCKTISYMHNGTLTISVPFDKKTAYLVLINPDHLKKIDNAQFFSKVKKEKDHNKRLFFLLDTNIKYEKINAHEKENLIHITDYNSYRNSFLVFLKSITNSGDLIEKINEFLANNPNSHPSTENKKTLQKEKQNIKFLFLNKNKNFLKFIGLPSLVMVLVPFIKSFSYFLFPKNGFHDMEFSRADGTFIIRSDSTTPSESAYLLRPQVIRKILENIEAANGSKTVVLLGIGGAGKTTLARDYMQSSKASIVWEMDASSPSMLIKSIENFVKNLPLTEKEKKAFDTVKKTKNIEEKNEKLFGIFQNYLKNSPDWVLIYDNVDCISQIKKYLPQPKDMGSWGNGRLLITTQNKNIMNTSYINPESTIYVEPLSSEEAFTLFAKILFDNKHEKIPQQKKQEIHKFLESIPHFPLDVSLAARYIKNGCVSYAQYLDLLKNDKLLLEKIQKKVLNNLTEYNSTRYGIVSLSFKKIIEISPEFSEPLLLLCLLDSREIPIDLFKNCKNIEAVDEFIYHLKKYSLVMLTPSSVQNVPNTLSVHQSTQEFGLDYLANHLDSKEKKSFFKKAVKIALEYSAKIIRDENVPLINIMTKHFSKILSHKKLFDEEMMYQIKNTLGALYYYSNTGFYSEGKEILEDILKSIKNNKFKNVNDISGLIYLGLIYIDLSEYKELIALLDYINKNFANILSQQTQNSAFCLSFLGNMHDFLGLYEEGKQLLEKSCQIYEEKFPHDYNGLARALCFLGNVNRKLGDYEIAKTQLERSYEIYMKYDPHNYYRLGWLLTTLGNLYLRFGDLNRSINCLEESSSLYKNRYKEKQIFVGWSPIYLANAYIEARHYEKAFELLNSQLTINQKYFLEMHKTSILTFFYLGKLYLKLGDFSKAQFFLEKSLKLFQENFGKDHIETAHVLIQMGKFFMAKNQLDNATQCVSESIQILEKKEHPAVYEALEVLCDIYVRKCLHLKQKGRIQEAQRYILQAKKSLCTALTIARKYLGSNNIMTQQIEKKQNGLGSVEISNV